MVHNWFIKMQKIFLYINLVLCNSLLNSFILIVSVCVFVEFLEFLCIVLYHLQGKDFLLIYLILSWYFKKIKPQFSIWLCLCLPFFFSLYWQFHPSFLLSEFLQNKIYFTISMECWQTESFMFTATQEKLFFFPCVQE